ncbi:LysM peptidoglycan-binding domain-containing protein [Massilia antarctica]|uniref:LysM peptidoglycan-binding domain-containing protein n=1 Tax=Massilia antarctica TaxID=2765360 RepID=UPI00226DC22C|nr:LysM peptidoglycan-binding domain-containing protein [Massilia sp. H27-R4]
MGYTAAVRPTYFSYDNVGNLTKTTRWDGTAHTDETFIYDANNRLVSDVIEGGTTALYAYDAAGQRTRVTDGNGHQTQYAYDALNRLIKVKVELDKVEGQPLGTLDTLYAYDLAGDRVASTDANGHVTSYAYDQLHRMVSKTGALGGITRYVYDKAGNLTSTIAPGKDAMTTLTTSATYDANGHLLSQTDAMGATTSFTYDAMGNRLSTVDAKGSMTTSVYDAASQLMVVTDALGGTTTHSYDAIGNVIATIDANGHEVKFSYDTAHRVHLRTDAAGLKTYYEFDRNGNLMVEREDGDNVRYLESTYDSQSRLVKVHDSGRGSAGFASTAQYDAAGNRIRVTDGNMTATTFAYDAANRLIGQTDVLGQTTTYGYDKVGNRTSMTDPNGNTTVYVYDAENRLVEQTDALLNKKRFVFDKAGDLVTSIDENGNETQFAYDANKRVISQTDATGNTTFFSYDMLGNRTAETDALGATVRYAFDKLSRLTARTDALGHVTAYAYDAVGNQVSTTDAHDATTLYTYDASNRRIKQETSLGHITTYAYNHGGQVVSQIDPLGAETRYTYDVFGHMVRTEGPNDHITDRRFDYAGNLIEEQDLHGFGLKTYAYDKANRLISSTDALGNKTSFEYDAAGNRIAQVDPKGNRIDYSFDALNRLAGSTNVLGEKTSYGYDAVGNRVSSTDGNGNITLYAYDGNGRQVSQTSALKHVTRNAYDAVGNLTSQTDANGAVIRMTYDLDRRMTSRTDGMGNITRFEYDQVDNRTKVIDANLHATAYVYDSGHQLLSETDHLGRKTSYTYDAAGNRTAIEDANGNVTRFEFNLSHQLTKRIDAEEKETAYTYDSTGELALERVAGPNGKVETRSYDKAGRLKAQRDAGGNTTTFAYDANGNRVSTRDSMGHASYTAYDAANRVIAQEDATGHIMRFGYDAAGNMVSREDGRGNTTLYRFDQENRLASEVDALKAETQYTYDATGQRIGMLDANGNQTTYTFDKNSRLIGQKDAYGNEQKFSYDAVGNRLSRTDAAGNTTHFAYDGANQLSSETDPLGNTTAYQYDRVGNRTVVTDAKGHKTSFTYDSLHRVLSQTDPLGHKLGYAYSKVANMRSATDAKGNTVTSTYDAMDRLLTESGGADDVTNEYDVVGNLVSVRDARGYVTSYGYDEANRLIRETDALGNISRYAYDKAGNRTEVTDANGNTTIYSYDAVNRLDSSADALGRVTGYGYDKVGNRISILDGNRNLMRFAFDAHGRVLKQTDELDQVTSFEYDQVGNRTAMTDSGGARTTYSYDGNGRMVGQVAADGVVTALAYDKVGNRLSQSVAVGTTMAATTSWAYNDCNEKISETNAVGGVITYRYDANHNLIASTDELGFESTYAYDAKNRLLVHTDPLGGKTSYTYDAVGNVLTKTDPRAKTESFSYDRLNRLVMHTDPLSQHATYQYDAVGNRVSEVLDTVTTKTVYDKANQAVAVIDGNGFRTERAYDGAGNVTEIRRYLDLDKKEAQVTRLYYDRLNRNIAQRSAEGYLSTIAYDAAGNVSSTTAYATRVDIPFVGMPLARAGDGKVVIRYAYDKMHRQTAVTDCTGALHTSTYDEHGNRTSTSAYQDTPFARATTTVYDLLGRKTKETDARGKLTVFDYDAAGNLLSSTDGANPDGSSSAAARTTAYRYDANRRVIGLTDPLGNQTIRRYDENGNLTSETSAAGIAGQERTMLYTYDAVNQLARASNMAYPDQFNLFQYDAAGNRTFVGSDGWIAQKFHYDAKGNVDLSTDATGVATRHRYDGAGNLIETIEADRVGSDTQAGSHTRYTYDLDNRLIAITDPMQGVTTFELDSQGNRIKITDAEGRVTTQRFDAAGRLLTSLAPDGALTTNVYSAAGTLASSTLSKADGSDARTTVNSYDKQDHLISTTDALGYTSTITYDQFGNRIQTTNGAYLVVPTDAHYSAAAAALAKPVTTTATYDKLNHVIQTTDGVGMVTTAAYDARGNRTSLTAASGSGDQRTTLYAYDLADRMVKKTSPGGAVVRYEYGTLSMTQPTKEIRENGDQPSLEISYSYDPNGRLTSTTTQFGTTETNRYDAAGNVIATYTGDSSPGHGVTRQYDANGRVSTETDGQGNRTSYTYDKVGNRRTMQDANGNVTTYWYDSANRVSAARDPLGYLTTYRYDVAGNLVETRQSATALGTVVDLATAPVAVAAAGDRVVRAEFDKNKRLLASIGADGYRTVFEVDAAGNKVSETQYAGETFARVTRTVYDGANRAVKQVALDGAVSTYQYDLVGNMVSALTTAQGEAARLTTSAYDLDNHRVSTTTDPNGLNITERVKYDLLGNVVANIDGAGRVLTRAYDRAGRLLSISNSAGEVMKGYAYDSYGNVSSEQGSDGFKYYTYDGANRKIKESRSGTTQFSIVGGFRGGDSISSFQYDGFGNVVQAVDASGFVTTNYYDANNRLVSQVDADNVLREYQYDAYGHKTGERMYMTRFTAARDPNARPDGAALGGEVRAHRFEYDAMGRQTRKVYPEVLLATLTDSGGASPSTVMQARTPEERSVYDAYGNVIESVALDGGRTRGYFDSMNRLVAEVDPMGYLTQYDVDSSGNVVAKRVYATALDTSKLTPSIRPVAPAGPVAVSTYVYDSANRLVEMRAPAVIVTDQNTHVQSSQIVVTRRIYDKSGNLIEQVVGEGTPSQQIEYSYYDSRNRRVGVIDAAGTLTMTMYDAGSHVTAQVHYLRPVGSQYDLTTVAGDYAQLNALVDSADGAQLKLFQYNARGQVERELVSISSVAVQKVTSTYFSFSTSFTSKSYSYDAVGNRSYTMDEAGAEIKSGYDGMGRTVQVIQPDGSGTRQLFDAAGNTVLTFSGEMSSTVAAATGMKATIGDALTLNYNVGAAGMISYILWDTASHADPAAYAHQTEQSTNLASNLGKTVIPRPAYGSAVFYRVVTQDSAGNRIYTSEQKVVMPVRVDDIQVYRPDPASMRVRVKFDGGVVAPDLLYGTRGNANTVLQMSLSADGYYEATLPLQGDSNNIGFKLQWTGTDGATFVSAEKPFQAPNDRVSSYTTTTEKLVDGGVQLNYSVNPGIKYSLITAQWRVAGSGAAFAVTGAADGVLTLGGDTPLVAGTSYEVLVKGVSVSGVETLIDHVIVTPAGIADKSVSFSATSWTPPPIGNTEVVVASGQPVKTERFEGRIIAHMGSNPYTSVGLYYSNKVAEAHSVSTSPSVWQEWEPKPVWHSDLNGGHYVDEGKWVQKGHDITYNATLTGAEIARAAYGLHLSWRDSSNGDGLTFTNDAMMNDLGGGNYRFKAEHVPLSVTSHDYKIWYMDNEGREVIVEWNRAATDAASTDSGYSDLVLAHEQGASVSGNVFANGTYIGQMSSADMITGMVLQSTDTGLAGARLDAGPVAAGHAIETTYNALNAKTGSTEADGVWREYRVDARGNAVQTVTLGVKGGAHGSSAYAQYDLRGNKVAQFDTAFVPAGEGALRHPVTRYDYDYLGHVIAQTDALGYVTTSVFDAAGNKISGTDAAGHVKTYGYDALGHNVQVSDRMTQASVYTSYTRYDKAGNPVEQTDATGRSTYYGRDGFGRLTSVQVGTLDPSHPELHQPTMLTYDGQNHVLRQGNVEFTYDVRGNRISEHDADNYYGHRRTMAYDKMGRVISVTTYSGWATGTTAYRAYDVFGNLVSTTDAGGKTDQSVFGDFGRLMRSIDADGNAVVFSYDELGRQTGETSVNTGRNIRRTYDDAGQLTEINDLGTGVSTRYTYDLMGRKAGETVSGAVDIEGRAHNRALDYAFDAMGRMTHWKDAVTGMEETITYDGMGNQVRVQGSGGGTAIDHGTVYDAAGRVEHLLNGGAVVGTYTYDPSGNRSSYRQADGSTTIYSYDAQNRPIQAYTQKAPTSWTITDNDTRYYGGRDGAGNIVYKNATVQDALKAIALRNYSDLTRWTKIASDNGLTDFGADAYATLSGRTLVLTHEESIDWKYDAVGNNTAYEERRNGAIWNGTVKTFDDASNMLTSRTETRLKMEFDNGYMPYTSSDGFHAMSVVEAISRGSNTAPYVKHESENQDITQEFNGSGKISRSTLRTSGGKVNKTYNYLYDYFGDGREKSIRAFGDGKGNANFVYNADNKLISMNQGKGDGLDRDEMSYYVYDNADHILSKLHDDGHSAGRDRIDYMYAQGNAVAETGTSIKDGSYTVMDSKNYALFQNFGKEFPSGGMQSYTVKGGESLQNIADSMYGNASLWYLIADANGLSGNETLKAGQVLRVPSSSQSGTIDAAAHKVYSDSENIGSKLPNLKSNPPKKSGCSSFLQVLVIIVAIVASCVLGPAMLLLVEAVGATGAVATVAAAALTGAAVSVVTQVTSIAVGLQDSFSWKAVAKGALVAAVTAGIGGAGAVAGESIATTVLNGVIQNVATQGMNMMLGEQKKFSWKSAAAAGISAGVAQGVGGLLTDAGVEPGMLHSGITNAARDVTSQLVVSGKVDWRSVAVNAAMMPINAAVGKMTGGSGVAGALGEGLLGAISAKLNKKDAWAGAIGGVVGSAVGQLAPMGMRSVGWNPAESTPDNGTGGRSSQDGADDWSSASSSGLFSQSPFSSTDPYSGAVGAIAGHISEAIAIWTHRDENVASQTANGVASSTYNGIIQAARKDAATKAMQSGGNGRGDRVAGQNSYQVGTAEYNQAVRNGEIEPATTRLPSVDANGTGPGLSYSEKLRAGFMPEPIGLMPGEETYTVPVNAALGSSGSQWASQMPVVGMPGNGGMKNDVVLDTYSPDDLRKAGFKPDTRFLVEPEEITAINMEAARNKPDQVSRTTSGDFNQEKFANNAVAQFRKSEMAWVNGLTAPSTSDLEGGGQSASVRNPNPPNERYGAEGPTPGAIPQSDSIEKVVRELLRDPEFADLGIPGGSGLPRYRKAIGQDDYSLNGGRTLFVGSDRGAHASSPGNVSATEDPSQSFGSLAYAAVPGGIAKFLSLVSGNEDYVNSVFETAYSGQVNQRIAGVKDQVQEKIVDVGAWGLRQNNFWGNAVNFGSGAAYAIDAVFQPDSMEGLALTAASPVLGEVAAPVIKSIPKIPGLGGLGWDVGAAFSRTVVSPTEKLFQRGNAALYDFMDDVTGGRAPVVAPGSANAGAGPSSVGYGGDELAADFFGVVKPAGVNKTTLDHLLPNNTIGNGSFEHPVAIPNATLAEERVGFGANSTAAVETVGANSTAAVETVGANSAGEIDQIALDRAERAAATQQRKAAGKLKAQERTTNKIDLGPKPTEVFDVEGIKYARVDALNGEFVEGKIFELADNSRLVRAESVKLKANVLKDMQESFKSNGGFKDNVLVVARDATDNLNILVGNNRYHVMQTLGYKGPYQVVEVSLPFRGFVRPSDFNPHK